jgi:hypothetical protein
MPLARTASAAARADEAEQRHRLRHAFEFVATALLGYEQTRDLPLHSRRDHDLTRLGQRLRPRRDIWHVAKNLPRGIYNHRPRINRDARGTAGTKSHCQHSLTISELHYSFALFLFLLFRAYDAKPTRGHEMGKSQKWHGVKQKPPTLR